MQPTILWANERVEIYFEKAQVFQIRTVTMMMMMMMMTVTQQIPHMTKSHHGGNMSLIGEVGFCHRHIPTIDNFDDDW